MSVSIVAKVKMLPTEEQDQLLKKTMQAYTSACNFVSEYVYKTHELGKDNISKVLYYPIRSKYGLGAQMTQSVFRTVIAKYKTIKENGDGWIKPSFKHPQCDLVWSRDYSLVKDRLSINTVSGRIKTAYETKGMEQFFDGDVWKFGTAKLVNKKGKWCLHIAVTNKTIAEANKYELEHVVGVDLGMNFLATSYDGRKTTFYSGKQIKHKRAQYSKTRKELQKRQTASARRRLKKIGNRENRWIQDVNHCVSKTLVAQNPSHTLFVLEDLTGIRGATEKVVLKNRYVSVSWAFYDLRQKIQYKAILLNKSVAIAVDPAYTSQRCPICGHTEAKNRDKKKHLFTCKACGYRSNDDRIGAINLYNKGIKYLDTVMSEHTSGIKGAVNHPAM